jgi:predicted DCC family thiol-disulfide oxidoreductase YuxK
LFPAGPAFGLWSEWASTKSAKWEATWDFLLRFDNKDILRFSSRHSEAGAGFVLQSGIPPGGAGSIIVVEDNRIRLRSDAVLRMLSLLGFPFSLLGIFRLIPAALRDAVYDVIARNRKRWFGKSTHCRIPAPSERHRFL